jgi:hypothetical protein
MRMRGAWTHLDIAPQEAYRMNILPEDNTVGVDVSGSYFAEGIAWEYESRDSFLSPLVTWNVITQNDLVGDTIVVPPAPVIPPWQNPNPNFPPLPPIYDFPTPPDPLNLSLAMIYVRTSTNRVFACNNLLDYEIAPTWFDITAETTPSISSTYFYTDWVTGSLYALSGGDLWISRPVPVSGRLFATQMVKWVEGAGIPFGAEVGNTIDAFGVNPLIGEIALAVASPGVIGRAYFVGDAATGEFVFANTNTDTDTFSSPIILTIGNGRMIAGWMVGTIGARFYTSNLVGGAWAGWVRRSDTESGSSSYPARSWHIRPDPMGVKVFHFSSRGAVGICESNDLCTTSSFISSGHDFSANSVTSNLDGTVLLANNRALGQQRYSLDGGKNWSTSSPTVVARVSRWAGTVAGNDIWLNLDTGATTDRKIRLSTDNGQTWSVVSSELEALMETGEEFSTMALVL